MWESTWRVKDGVRCFQTNRPAYDQDTILFSRKHAWAWCVYSVNFRGFLMFTFHFPLVTYQPFATAHTPDTPTPSQRRFVFFVILILCCLSGIFLIRGVLLTIPKVFLFNDACLLSLCLSLSLSNAILFLIHILTFLLILHPLNSHTCT